MTLPTYQGGRSRPGPKKCPARLIVYGDFSPGEVAPSEGHPFRGERIASPDGA